MNNVQVLTVLVEVMAFVGILVSLFLIWVRIAGLEALKREGQNGYARYVSIADLRGDLFVLVVLLLILGLAVIAHINIFRGDPPYSDIEEWANEHVSVVLRYVLGAVVAILIVKQIWKVFDWQHLTGLSVASAMRDALRRRRPR